MAAERKFAVVQEGRLVALPGGIEVNPGDIVAFETTDSGILLVPQNAQLNATLDELGAALLDGGRDLETLIADGREIRDELLLELYGIDSEQP
jgi:hypothetical protein